jgi:predicted DNA-binding transcriptional regulator YafY
MSRTSRLFEFINILRGHRMPVTADDLARNLGISPRSVYRDIETLRSLGAPVDGQAGIGFRLGDGFFLPEFALLPEEIDALTIGLGWVRQRADPALARNSESALAKILATTSSTFLGHEYPPPFFSAASLSQRMDPPQVAQLRDAVRRQRKVAISYEDARGTVSERVIWPIAIVYFDDVRVLAAWCEAKAAFRHFRVDRVQVSTMLSERYPGRRHALVKKWRQQDRDWRAILTVSGGAPAYQGADAPADGASSKED